MEDLFKNPSDNEKPKGPDSKPESFDDSELEKLRENIEDSAQNDLNNFERSNNEFIENQKKILGFTEKDPALEIEILKVKEKYQKERKKLKTSFLSKLNRISKFALDSVVTLAFVVHFSQKEAPDYLDRSQEKEPKKIEWNEATKKEIKKLAHEYALIIKTDNAGYNKISETIFEERFANFVATYGPDIQIVHPGDDMSVKDKIYDLIFEGVLRQKSGRAHDALGGTLFYENKTLRKKQGKDVDTTEYDMETSSLRDFAEEFSHHINKDWSLRRAFAYADGLIRNGFHQEKMYEDPYSPEYQAHQITQSAISEYLFPDSNDLSVNFVDIYNTKQEYYREFVKMKGYANDEDIQMLTWRIFYKKFSKQEADKEIVFKNLEKIRSAIDKAEISDDLKGSFFKIMVERFKLDTPENNYEAITKEAGGINEILKKKKLALNDSTQFGSFVQEIENKYATDSNYMYVSLTPEIFENNFYDEMREKTGKAFGEAYENNDSEQIESMEKLYRLHIYAILKSIEGEGLGYGSNPEYDYNGAFEKYSSDLREVKRLLEKREGIENSKSIRHLNYEIEWAEKNEQLSYALVAYLENDKSQLIKYIQKEDGSDYPFDQSRKDILLRLLSGLEKYGKPDLKRDFFINNQSPLKNILYSKQLDN